MKSFSVAYYFISTVFLFLLVGQNVSAQITIKDKIMVNPRGEITATIDNKGKIADPGEHFYPVVQQISANEYLILKSGHLKFYFEHAESYGINNVSDHVLNYSVYGSHTNITESVPIADYFEGPIVVKEGANLQCPENQTYFKSYKTIPIGPTDDTWIWKWSEVAENGDSSVLHTNGFGFIPFEIDSDPDSAQATVYVQFGIGKVQTNAQLTSSYLTIQADDILTDIEAPFLIYRVDGAWTEETLSYENRPATDLFDYLIADSSDIIIDIGNTYSKNITSYTQQWLNGSKADHGVRLVSTARHVFASKESILTTIPTIGLNLSLPAKNVDPILDMGYVEAGDTLHVDYLGFNHYSDYNYTPTPDSINAEYALIFEEKPGCKAQNIVQLLPFMEEDTTKAPYFEFVLNQSLTIPLDSVPEKEIYLEPKIKFENGITKLPGNIFTFLTMEIYDVPFIELPDNSQSFPIALLDGRPDGRAYLGSHRPGDNIDVLTIPETQDSTFKIRIVGELIKGLILVKQNPLGEPNTNSLPAYSSLEGVRSKIENDPYCGVPEEYAAKDGFFVTCFEFTIGESKTIEILLGDSKYFYAVADDEDPSNLLIKELQVSNSSNAPLDLPEGGIANAFSGDDIIDVVSGGKSGVYWERKRALISADGTVTMQDLPNGLVRLIGRYWEPEKEYKVKLKAVSENQHGELEIKVIKPNKLGDRDRTYTDAINQKYNVDSLAIVYGGRTGMPPQFLKAMISKETSMNAGYRYEPNTDYSYNHWKTNDQRIVHESMKNNPYWITDAGDLGIPTIPTNHSNILDGNGNIISYPGFEGTLYDLFSPHRDNEVKNSTKISSKLVQLKKDASTQLIAQNITGLTEIDSLAQQLLTDWLKNTYRGGLVNIAKQTRIVASYGPLQLIYLYGFYEVRGFPLNVNYLPETLNENVDFALEYSLRFYIENKFNKSGFSRNDTQFSVVSE